MTNKMNKDQLKALLLAKQNELRNSNLPNVESETATINQCITDMNRLGDNGSDAQYQAIADRVNAVTAGNTGKNYSTAGTVNPPDRSLDQNDPNYDRNKNVNNPSGIDPNNPSRQIVGDKKQLQAQAEAKRTEIKTAANSGKSESSQLAALAQIDRDIAALVDGVHVDAIQTIADRIRAIIV
jgi:hypothetical protein